MDERDLARSLALGRIAVGASLLALPGVVGAVWLGRSAAASDAARVVLRAVGARDLALGLGLKAALDRDAPLRGWLEGGLLADGTDLAATLAAGDGLPAPGRVLVASLAGSAVALGAYLHRSAEAGAAPPEPPEREPARAGASNLTTP